MIIEITDNWDNSQTCTSSTTMQPNEMVLRPLLENGFKMSRSRLAPLWFSVVQTTLDDCRTSRFMRCSSAAFISCTSRFTADTASKYILLRLLVLYPIHIRCKTDTNHSQSLSASCLVMVHHCYSHWQWQLHSFNTVAKIIIAMKNKMA